VAARRGAGAGSRAGRATTGGLPDASGDAPLHTLGRDQLSVFLFLALLPEETAALVKEWRLAQPGFRREALGEVQRCDLLADEIRASPEGRLRVVDLLARAFGGLPLARLPLRSEDAAALAAVARTDSWLAQVLWRILADPDPAVRAIAGPLLDELVAQHYGPAEGGGQAAEGPPEAPPAPAGAEERTRRLEARLAAAERQAAESAEKAELAQRRGEEGREKLQAQLREARAGEAEARAEAARAREAAEAARRDLGRAEARLAEAAASDLAAEAQRARAAARDLEGRAAALESRLERARLREEELERELEAARREAATAAQPPAEAAADEPEEAPASWLLPVYTKEFYDSLEGWDRRIQRAAFKQAHLLAQDHRHPSLRALPLEGLPGYYRVRVATDVRLLYRRGERQSAVEVLSLIDREDLDRYVRQAKTRT
jgi:hypothetical protein